MKSVIRFTLPALLLVMAACAEQERPSAPAAPADTLRLVVYNIHHGEGMDEVVDLDRIAALIASERPDIVALQEIDSVVTRTAGVDQAAELGRLTGMQPVFGRFMAYQGGAYGMAMLTRWPLAHSRVIRLPDGDEPRASVVITVQSPSTGREITIADVHFYRTEEERMAQAMTLDSTLSSVEGPVVMTGDFNSTPGSPVMEALGEGWQILDKGEDRLTFSSFDPQREIDFVLTRPAGAFKVLDHRVLSEPVASDHRALVAVLAW